MGGISMSEKCCGNCKYFKYEDVNGEGFCIVKDSFESSIYECGNHEFRNNGWTEITPDNVDELYDKPIAVAWKYEDKTYYSLAGDCALSLSTMAKYGGYYYMELPELKIE